MRDILSKKVRDMEAMFSVYCNGICYGRTTTLKLAERIAKYCESVGLSAEVEASYVYSRNYEVEELMQRMKSQSFPS